MRVTREVKGRQARMICRVEGTQKQSKGLSLRPGRNTGLKRMLSELFQYVSQGLGSAPHEAPHEHVSECVSQCNHWE